MPPVAGKTVSDARLLASFGRLNIDPGIAQKSTKVLRYVIDNASEACNAYDAYETADVVELAASVMAVGGINGEAAGYKVTAFSVNELSLSLKMGKALTMTPGRATALIFVVLGQKAMVVAGIASESQANECRVAIGKLAADVAVTALTWETGVGAVLGVAGAALDAGVAFQSCRK
jgi:hypothetical protein